MPAKKKLEGNKSIESDIPLFDGFIWTSAKDRELKLNDVLDAVARTLDWPGIAQQPVEEKRESVRKLLQTKRYLLVLDNFETITDESIRDFLVKLPEPSKALITSREQKLREARAVSIKGLEQNEALILIRNEGQRLGLKSIENAEDPVLIHLYQANGGAPLAIKWAVGQIKQKGQSLDTALSALHEAKGDIFEEVFARSWSLLTEDAKKVLLVMPIFASSASKDAIEVSSDVHHFALDEALGQLVQMWLVEVTDELEAAKRRYSVHPLTRAFAGLKLKEFSKFDYEAKNRVNEFYLDFLQKHGGMNFQHYDLLETEKENILSIIEWCFKNGLFEKVLRLTKDFYNFLAIRGYWQEQIYFGEIGIESAKRCGDKTSLEKISLGVVSWTYLKMGKYEEAEEYIKQSIEIAEAIQDQKTIARGIRYFGKIAREKNQLSYAEELVEKSLEIAYQQNDVILQYHLYSDLGQIALYSGNYSEAESMFKKAISGFKELDTEDLLMTKLALLGDALILQRKSEEAQSAYQECLAISQKYARKDTIARAKLGLAKLNEKNDNLVEAKNLVNESYILFQKLGMKKYIKEAEEMIERLARN